MARSLRSLPPRGHSRLGSGPAPTEIVVPDLHLLSAGAAKGLLLTLQPEVERDLGVTLHAEFGAVGAMLERLNAGAPCDVIVLTRAMIDALARDERVDAASVRDLGWVHTGVALPNGAAQRADADARSMRAVPDVPALRAVLVPARSIYLPDPERATAGIHALRVLRALELPDLDARLRTFANGAAAMAALAEADAHAVGITQVSEILYTPGVQLLGALPAPHGLATRYSAAAMRGAAGGAMQLLERLSAPSAARWRQQRGFEASAA
jgi:molybdate transport system substrate-binding protein